MDTGRASPRRLAPAPVDFRTEFGRLAPTLLPIALGYHLSHYLTVLLVNGQYWLAALADPLGSGTPIIGPGQALLVIGGHLLAVALAHLTALDLHRGDRRGAAIGQLPLAVLMVLYTALGLWLLATPAGA